MLAIGLLLKALCRVFSKDHFWKLPGNNFLTWYLDTCAFCCNWELGHRWASNRWREVTPIESLLVHPNSGGRPCLHKVFKVI